MYERSDRTRAERFAQDTQIHPVISVDHDVMSHGARTGAGALYDAFRIRMSGPSVEAIPAKLGPERVRP